MKSLICRINLALSIAIFLLLTQAHVVPTHAHSISSALQETNKSKDELYATFKKGISGDANARKASNEAGKEFLAKYPDDSLPG